LVLLLQNFLPRRIEVRQRILILFIAVVTNLMMASSVIAQEEVLKLEHQAFGDRQRPAVTFSHAKHYETIACTECHHFYEKGENVWDESRETNCAACHRLKTEERKMGLMKAFHENCVGCHRKAKPAEGKTVPVTCGECHVKSR
jgi:hypothetical protein